MGEHYVYQAEPTTGSVSELAHKVNKGDPKVDGPYLDDVNEKYENTYRKNRTKNLRAAAKKVKAATGKKKAALKEATQNPEVDALVNEHKPVAPGEERAKRDVVEEFNKANPLQRQISTPTHEPPEDNDPKPKLEDSNVPERVVNKATADKPNRKNVKKSTMGKKSKAEPSFRAKPVAKKSVAAKPPVAKKTVASKKAAAGKKK